jgi:hypothetical protein
LCWPCESALFASLRARQQSIQVARTVRRGLSSSIVLHERILEIQENWWTFRTWVSDSPWGSSWTAEFQLVSGSLFWMICIGPTDGLWHWQAVRVGTSDSCVARDVSCGSVSLFRWSVVPVRMVRECDGWYVPSRRTVCSWPCRFGLVLSFLCWDSSFVSGLWWIVPRVGGLLWLRNLDDLVLHLVHLDLVLILRHSRVHHLCEEFLSASTHSPISGRLIGPSKMK